MREHHEKLKPPEVENLPGALYRNFRSKPLHCSPPFLLGFEAIKMALDPGENYYQHVKSFSKNPG
jgi:hypothetical protein